MAVQSKYNSFLKNQMNGVAPIDFDTDTIKVSLHTATYVPDAATHDFFDDVTNEVTGTNYTAGGNALATKTLTELAGVVKFDADDSSWLESGTGFSDARIAVIYKDTGVPSTSPLFSYIDFLVSKSNISGDLILVFNSSGIASWQ